MGGPGGDGMSACGLTAHSTIKYIQEGNKKKLMVNENDHKLSLVYFLVWTVVYLYPAYELYIKPI